ncbi:hypothetical protein ACT7CZ_15555 [Bacillus cereus]
MMQQLIAMSTLKKYFFHYTNEAAHEKRESVSRIPGKPQRPDNFLG